MTTNNLTSNEQEKEQATPSTIVRNVFRTDLKKVYDKRFTDLHLIIFIYLQQFTVLNRDSIQFCFGWLYDDLDTANNQTKQDIQQAFIELINMNYIRIKRDLDIANITRNTRVELRAIKYDDNFTILLDEEVNKIIYSKLDFRLKRTMLFLYCDIASRIDDKEYCYPSFESFRRDLDTKSDNRINDALEKLKELQLIDYDNPGQVVIDGEVTQANNIYVLCSTKDYKQVLRKALADRKKQLERGKAKVYKATMSNKQRSIKQRINHLHSKYDENISDDELKDLNKLELEYYNLNVNDKINLSKTDFKTIKLTEEFEIETEKADNKILVGRRAKSFSDEIE